MGGDHDQPSGTRYWITYGLVAVAGLVLLIADYEYVGKAALAVIVAVTAARFLYMVYKKKFTVDLLMAVVGAITLYYGYLLEGLVIMVLYSIAELVEHAAESYARRRLERLTELVPRRAALVDGGVPREVPVEELRPGNVVLVRRGEAVPADGVLLDNGLFDASVVTGEAEPLELRPGDSVESGYVNLGNPARVRLVRSPNESTLQRMVKTALEALEAKARLQRFVEKIAPPMTILVLGSFAILLYTLGPLRSLPLLLAGCPSAFIVASGYSTAFTIASLARAGIVAKGGRALESAARVRVVVFDKTGTLSLGRLRLASYKPPAGMSESEFLRVAVSAASASAHPISKAIAASVRERVPVQRVREYPAKGLEAEVNGYNVLLGSRRLLEERGYDAPHNPCGEGYTPVYVAVNGSVGYLCLEEEIDPAAYRVISRVKGLGCHVVILSGDRRERVEKTAKQLDVDEYYYEARPEDKLEKIKELRAKYGPVAVVGDGINDMEALAASDLGVAVGNIDAVNTVADVSLVSGIQGVPRILSQARRYLRALYASIAVAAAIKITIIGLGIAGKIPLILAALLGDDGSTVAAILTATMLLMKRYA